MTAFATLLLVQDHDTHIDQLLHRRRTLPARDELAAAEQQRAELSAQREVTAGTVAEIAGRQDTAENEIAAAERRIADIDARMRSGAVTASRDLQAMQGEINSIRTRISMLEDDALQAMDEREPLDTQLADLDARIAEIDDTIAELRRGIGESEAAIDAEVAAERAERDQTAAQVDASLLDRYEKLRARLGGVGAARLDGNRCAGCHLTLPATELDRIRREPADALIQCEQCERILVRA